MIRPPPPDTLRINTTPAGHIRIAGHLDAANVSRLHTAMDVPLTQRPGRLDLDVSGLEFCDASGLAALVQTRNRQPTPSDLILHGASRQLRRLLRITRLDGTFTLT